MSTFLTSGSSLDKSTRNLDHLKVYPLKISSLLLASRFCPPLLGSLGRRYISVRSSFFAEQGPAPSYGEPLSY